MIVGRRFSPVQPGDFDYGTPLRTDVGTHPGPAPADVERTHQADDGGDGGHEGDLFAGVATDLQIDPGHVAVEGDVARTARQLDRLTLAQRRPERLTVRAFELLHVVEIEPEHRLRRAVVEPEVAVV